MERPGNTILDKRLLLFKDFTFLHMRSMEFKFHDLCKGNVLLLVFFRSEKGIMQF